ncbi:MAG: hypothetical protein FGM36_16455, partial [Burkholderiaceae bacterium]|nr:hypothetical protein [Burkholderiaceae bacterium]
VLSFDLNFQGNIYKQIKAPLIGKHNALNTASVFALALLLGAKEKELREAIASFHGVARRADKIGEACGTLFYDDYGHHPVEMAAVLAAARGALEHHRQVRLIGGREQLDLVADREVVRLLLQAVVLHLLGLDRHASGTPSVGSFVTKWSVILQRRRGPAYLRRSGSH